MTLQAADIVLENSRKSRVASAIIDLLLFYKTEEGRPQDIVTKMRFVVETYCTYTYPSSSVRMTRWRALSRKSALRARSILHARCSMN